MLVLRTLATFLLTTQIVLAGQFFLDDTTVSSVAVNGGTDTVNPGTTCLKVALSTNGSCAGEYIGIPNNNKILIAAALAAKVSGQNVMVYYADTANHHCPGLVFTACTLISIEVLP
jgi:hypothetical protein